MRTGVKCGKQQENADVDSIEWQMKNGYEIDTRSFAAFYVAFPQQVSSRLRIWGTHCTHWRSRVQKHYLFFILCLELESKSTIWTTIEQRSDREMKSRETYLGFRVSFDLRLWVDFVTLLHITSKTAYCLSASVSVIIFHYPTGDFTLHNISFEEVTY